MTDLNIPTHTLEQQSIASDPKHSAWVSANAGSGKTHVLTQRVVRLLLNGTNPARILCLTFTKAAAGEMANRVFETLGKWAVMPDDELAAQIKKIEGGTPKPATLDFARTLFARALETPGGLKIQTIHAFCEALLHQFPLEANVSGNFSVMDESAQKLLMEQARRDIVLAAESGDNKGIAQAFDRMMAFASDGAINKVMDELVASRDEILGWLEAVDGAQSATAFALRGNEFVETDSAETLIEAAVLECSFSSQLIGELIEAGQQSDKPTDQKFATKLQTFVRARDEAVDHQAAFDFLLTIFLTDGLQPRSFSRFVTKNIKAMFPGLESDVSAEADRLVTVHGRIQTLRQIRETEPLLTVADAMLTRYRNLKRARGLLDFDDLVSRSADLLQKADARAWVLYKLDLGIDHILLDEAQDTSPRQWQIVEQLAEEFFVGKTARNANRTVFAVGDEKQSIYSFQGARPESFSRQRDKFRRTAEAADKPLRPANLNLSFRSTPQVLGVVDAVFDHEDHAKGLTYLAGDYQSHEAQRRNDPGMVEVWDKFSPMQVKEPVQWHEPADPHANPHQADRLAEAVADRIQKWIDTGHLIKHRKDDVRPIRAGDIIVLVRARDRFIPALTRALKERHVPVAGTDRLSLTDHIAIKDLIALGQVVLTPQDDLSLAALLKSPLLGLDEDHLFTLAHGRDGSLFEALQSHREAEPFKRAFEKLKRWMAYADDMPVYEFYARVLGDDRGRRDFYARLGNEVEDVLDAFLALTLDRENTGLPGLHSFIEDFLMEQPEIKREFPEAQNEVRVMTIHAAKGLEAPIVFLVDKSNLALSGQHASALYPWGAADGPPEKRGFLWVPSSGDHGDTSQQSKQIEKEEAENEYRRQLYVGMTRAEDWLIICGYKGANAVPTPNWHTMITAALADDLQHLESIGETITKDGETEAINVRRWTKIDANAIAAGDAGPDVDKADLLPQSLPGWLEHRLPQERALPRPLNPSGAQALIDESLALENIYPSLLDSLGLEEATELAPQIARKRGTVLHRLLQVWPDLEPDTATEQALAYTATALPELNEAARIRMVEQLEAIITAPQLAPYLDPNTSRAEVPVMGRVDLASGPRPVSGTIDRMAVLADRVMLLDYKTSFHVPQSLNDVPGDYVTQMALYRGLIQRLYSDRPVEAALIWTHAKDGPAIMQLPADMLDDAFAELSKL